MLNMIRNRMRDEKGFTLIELMVVVLIIAILLAVAIPTFLGLRERAQNRAAQSDLRTALVAAKAFYTDGETYTGFDATSADAIEPSLTWNTAATAVEGAISIRVAADGNSIALATQSESTDDFCIAEDAALGTTRGQADAASYTACDQAADW